jgi:SAM-dependent methyltransferase
MPDRSEQTIRDFGAQWTEFPENAGYYASPALLADICGPLLTSEHIRGARAAEIGSGTGRIVNMLLDCGAAHVTALEPSQAIVVVRRNTADRKERVTYVQAKGDELPLENYDLIVSIGVLHHIHDPLPTVCRAHAALRPGGRFLAWLYGCEGNELYLRVTTPVRQVTRRIADPLLKGLCHALVAPLSLYAWLCRWLPLPMRGYMRSVISRLDWHYRFLVIFDQLNPAHAEYYSGEAARGLLEEAGFEDVQLYHRHGYSWTVIGTKRAGASGAK